MAEHGFQIRNTSFLQSVRSTVTQAVHNPTGALLVHLDCPEERENFFAACFRTPPEDDTGVPHIIEHTVLNGSGKYPVKDPFMEMVKSSMATFINAMTYGDRTVYPCGSMNRKDFMNLVSVYMDAVFHPLLKEESFMQEGYRLDYSEESGKLVHNGVVYNEMKGAYSDPDSLMEREVARLLYPGGSCGKDSGGDPPAVAGLTWEAFRDFYHSHYTPDNCCLFALTSIPFDDFAGFMDSRLPRGRKGSVKHIMQEPFTEPVRQEIPVPGSGEGCTVLSAWMVNQAGDPGEALAFSLLEEILLEDDSSPVKQALMDSGLGTGLSVCGYDSDPVQRNFIIGLKGVRRKRAPEVLELINRTLEDLSVNGLKGELVRDMLHRKELHLRHTGSGWPMALMGAVTAAWTHGEDICRTLNLDGLLEDLKRELMENPRFLEEMIRRWLIGNPHRADAVFYPHSGHFKHMEKVEERKLRHRLENTSRKELESIRERTERLEEYAAAANPPEALATLPKLELSDIPPSSGAIFHTLENTVTADLLSTEIDSRGVCYVDLALDLSELPEDLIPWAAFYGDLITRTGAGGRDHLELAEAELSCSGGISASVKCVTDDFCSIGRSSVILRVSGYCLENDLEKMLAVMEQRILHPDVTHHGRIVTVAGETAEHERSSLIPRGHTFAMLAARAPLSRGHGISNLLHGTPSLKLLDSVENSNAGKHAEVLGSIRTLIAAGVPATAAWTGPASREGMMRNWLEGLPFRPGRKLEEDREPECAGKPARLGLQTGPGTCFAAAALPGLPMGHRLYAPGTVFLRLLSEGYLWDSIRVQRGAYGAGASLTGGTVSFYSYRDPSPAESIGFFRKSVLGGIGEVDLTRRSIEDSIVAGMRGTDPPVRPAMANGIALARHFRGVTRERAREYREALLEVTAESVQEFAGWLGGSAGGMSLVVMGSEECMTSASAYVDVVEAVEGG